MGGENFRGIGREVVARTVDRMQRHRLLELQGPGTGRSTRCLEGKTVNIQPVFLNPRISFLKKKKMLDEQ